MTAEKKQEGKEIPIIRTESMKRRMRRDKIRKDIPTWQLSPKYEYKKKCWKYIVDGEECAMFNALWDM
jgi:hypothetical protein